MSANESGIEAGAESALLVQFQGEAIRQQWLLIKPVTRIGRWPDNDIVVPDRWVSRYHAEVRREGGRYRIQDLESKNGVFVNGRRLTGSHWLVDGDQVSLAPLFVLTFVDYAATAPLPGQKRAALILDPEMRNVYVMGSPVDPPLSQVQYDFMALLMNEPGRAFNRDEIIAAVWPGQEAAGISDDAINALVHRLRQRLRELDPAHEFIVTVRGYGFRLEIVE
jgi:DNA-binding response OmpR family regulator